MRERDGGRGEGEGGEGEGERWGEGGGGRGGVDEGERWGEGGEGEEERCGEGGEGEEAQLDCYQELSGLDTRTHTHTHTHLAADCSQVSSVRVYVHSHYRDVRLRNLFQEGLKSIVGPLNTQVSSKVIQ